MKCKYCQAELEDGAAICPVCGKEQDAAEEESVRAEQAPAPAQTPDNAETPASEEAAAEVQSPAVPEIKSGIKATPGKIALAVTAGIVVLAVLVALVISGISGGFASLKHTGADAQATTAPVETGTASTDAAEATEGTIPADGNPDDVTCKGTYTATDDEVIAAADTVVATMGGKELTVGQLQIYYWTEVYDFLNQYASYASYFGLDYTQPLDKQSCDLGETPMTWQQYFLQCAIDAWRSYQGLALEGEEAGLTMDAEFQGYLDSLPGDLEAMAADYGMADTAELMKANFGPAATMDNYIKYMEVYYSGYTYFGNVYDSTLPTSEQIEAYFTERESEYADEGVTKDGGKYYNVRHILVLVQGGTTDDDGNTTYSDEEWEACRSKAQEILDEWLNGEATEDSFAALANEKSEDTGSNTNGGLYTDLTADTNFVENFKAWYLDASRQPGDYGLVQTEYGYHIMYFSGSEDIWYEAARSDIISEKVSALVPAALEKYPAEVDYSVIKLGFVDLNA